MELSIQEQEDVVQETISVIIDNHEKRRTSDDDVIPQDFIQVMEFLVKLQKEGELQTPDFREMKKIYTKHAKMHPDESSDETPMDEYLDQNWRVEERAGRFCVTDGIGARTNPTKKKVIATLMCDWMNHNNIQPKGDDFWDVNVEDFEEKYQELMESEID